MALNVTSWPQSVGLRVVYEDAASPTLNLNCLGTGGTLHLAVVDNSEGNADVFLKIKDHITATASSEPDWLLRVKSGAIEEVFFDSSGDFSAGLCFWVCRNATAGDTTAPSVVTNGTVKVTLIVSQSSAEQARINTQGVGY